MSWTAWDPAPLVLGAAALALWRFWHGFLRLRRPGGRDRRLARARRLRRGARERDAARSRAREFRRGRPARLDAARRPGPPPAALGRTAAGLRRLPLRPRPNPLRRPLPRRPPLPRLRVEQRPAAGRARDDGRADGGARGLRRPRAPRDDAPYYGVFAASSAACSDCLNETLTSVAPEIDSSLALAACSCITCRRRRG